MAATLQVFEVLDRGAIPFEPEAVIDGKHGSVRLGVLGPDRRVTGPYGPDRRLRLERKGDAATPIVNNHT